MTTSDSPIPVSTSKTGLRLSLFLLSVATFTFEISLTRLFSVAQFYHFAFMIVSIALLGYGISGTTLAIFPLFLRAKPTHSMGWLSLGAGISILVAFLLMNWLPFDSYSLVIDSRQLFILILHYIALALPFFFSGMALAILLTTSPEQAGTTYAYNLVGSALGCVLALIAPGVLGGEGMVTLASLVSALAAVFVIRWQPRKLLLCLGIISLLLVNLLDLSLRVIRQQGLSAFALHISPYKSLSYALQAPDSKVIFSKWNAFSRVDVINSSSIHSIPGLSYRYLQPLPTIDGLFVDGEDLSPSIRTAADLSFSNYLPSAIAFQLHPQSSTLVLEPRGGLDIIAALALSKGRVTCVESNPLIVRAAPAYADQRLFIYQESERSFLQRVETQYDVIILSQTSSFHPVQSGAYTLAEDYRYTIESFQEILDHLAPEGLFITTRWLQDPPSEDLRLFALALTALEKSGLDSHQQLVAFRGYNTITVLIKKSAFTAQELLNIREFSAARAFDLTFAPDIRQDETNLYNILPDSIYYQTYHNLLEANPRQSFYDLYAYDVRPPTDDHPFFGHYFKWTQAPQVLAEFGKAWLPFGGSGYFVLLALLFLAIILAMILILLPVGLWRWSRRKLQRSSTPFLLRYLVYFGLLGFAFLFVEIPLLQRFMLYLGNAANAFTAVLFSLLFFSALGSRVSHHLSLPLSLIVLVILILSLPFYLPPLFQWTLGLPYAARLALTVLSLAPLGFFMGIPFPTGIRQLTGLAGKPGSGLDVTFRTDIPWIWAVNGAASVISPIMAAILALTLGFSVVLWLGAICYAAALLTVWLCYRSVPQSLNR
jgi:hypothetical protein